MRFSQQVYFRQCEDLAVLHIRVLQSFDNIYLKCAGYDNIDSKILMTDISDHYPIIACMGVTKGNKSNNH